MPRTTTATTTTELKNISALRNYTTTR
jgi:hypothetical protein